MSWKEHCWYDSIYCGMTGLPLPLGLGAFCSIADVFGSIASWSECHKKDVGLLFQIYYELLFLRETLKTNTQFELTHAPLLRMLVDRLSKYHLLTSNRWRGCRGRDHMVVGFTTTCAISAYHHWCCEFEPRSWRGVLYTTLLSVTCDRSVVSSGYSCFLHQ